MTESKFRRDSMSPIPGAAGSLVGENYFENRAKFETGNRPVATFPRSLSNLERRSGAVSANAESIRDGGDSRASSLPRPGSAGSTIDQEDYKNYVLEMIHSTNKSPR